jgi:ribosomal protein S27AE
VHVPVEIPYTGKYTAYAFLWKRVELWLELANKPAIFRSRKMSDGMAREAIAENGVTLSSAHERVYCHECGSDKVFRITRKGFLQKQLFAWFGYYPWRCTRCGKGVMLPKRKRAKTQHSARQADEQT